MCPSLVQKSGEPAPENQSRFAVYWDLLLLPYIFLALPFSIIGALLAQKGFPTLEQGFWILVAMFGARNGGMALNRLIDAKIDGQNPRAKGRAIPAGLVSRLEVIVMIVFFLGLLVLAAGMLNPLALKISPFCIGLLIFYSFCKRFTAMAHFVLGIIQACAPIGGWIAVGGPLGWAPFILGLAVIFWTMGFDILDKCPDVEFDKSIGLHSIPQLLGVKNALRVAFGLHVLTVLLLFYLWHFLALGWPFLVGVLGGTVLLAVEHHLVTYDTAGEKLVVDPVFFFTNTGMSLFLMLCTIIEVF